MVSKFNIIFKSLADQYPLVIVFVSKTASSPRSLLPSHHGPFLWTRDVVGGDELDLEDSQAWSNAKNAKPREALKEQSLPTVVTGVKNDGRLHVCV